MSNSYFKFKQFTIQQEYCAMKVSTDACIQGAWAPVLPDVQRVLDIGTGTGLLSLMLAQRYPYLHIHALELDTAAARQAYSNFENSPWKSQIELIHADVREYVPTVKYDMVVCNPPFFQDSLVSATQERRMAMHDISLSQVALFHVLQTMLQGNGYACIMLPAREHKWWVQLVTNNGWHICSSLLIYPRADKAYNRVVSICTPSCERSSTVTEDVLVIYQDINTYTEQFKMLLQPFYLYI